MYRNRRIRKYLYIVLFGAPPQDMWHKMRLIPAISAILDIDSNAHNRARAILEAISVNIPSYNGAMNPGGGRKAILEHGAIQVEMIYKLANKAIYSVHL